MIVNKNSWHYYLLQTYGEHSHIKEYYPDSCSYIRGIVKTALALAAITILCSVVIALTIGDVLSWITACIMMQTWIIAGCGAWFTGGLVVITLISVAFDHVKSAYKDRRRLQHEARDINKTPGFFKQAYDSIHNKYCTRIEVVG